MINPQSLQEIFLEALDREVPDERAAFLDRACGVDTERRRQVERLLSNHSDDAFLDQPAIETSERVSAGQDSPMPHAIGPFKVLEKIGEGGMGSVYMAKQQQPVRRKVALKIIKLGMDTKKVVARFEAERQALAMMDHPNIAKVLDAGNTEIGRPYFVMELVRGTSITEFCDENKLSIKQRLELFITICHAVQHAHQKGIIHRDIKPSNSVLVTLNDGIPHPMIIDFGIAKAIDQRLTEKTFFTGFSQMIGTPAYMSPEQAEMGKQDVDTRTDVYALGVLLYELLTGTTPFPKERLEAAGYAEMLRILTEEEPIRPSTAISHTNEGLRASASERGLEPVALLNSLSGDLDWIVLTAIAKDRTRRYATANDLAREITRHLDNEPILARPPTVAYRMRKAWQRNKLAYIAAGLVLASLCVGLLMSLWQAQRVSRSSYLSDMNLSAQAWAAGNMPRARELLVKHQPNFLQRDQRGFEWRLLWGLIHEDKFIRSFNAGSDTVESIALSPQARFLAWATSDTSVRISDFESDGSQTVLTGSYGSIDSLSFSQDGLSLAASTSTGIVDIWDLETMTLRTSLGGDASPIKHVSFHPKEPILHTIDKANTIRFWDLETGQLKYDPIESPVPRKKHILSPDGCMLATFGNIDTTVQFWRLGAGGATELPSLPPQKGKINVVTFAPDAKSVYIATYDSLVTRWQINPLTPTENFRQKVPTDKLALSANGKILATASSDKLIRIWNAQSGEEIRVLHGDTATIPWLALSTDGLTLASIDEQNEVKLWKTSLSKDRSALLHKGLVLGLDVSSDDRTLAVSDPTFDDFRLWDIQARQSTTLISNDKVGAAFSPDGKWLATSLLYGKEMVLWRSTGTGFQEEEPRVEAASSPGSTIQFSPDSKRLLFRGRGNSFVLWDLENAKQLGVLPDEKSWYCAVAFDSTGEIIATGSAGKIRIWNVTTFQQIAEISDQYSRIRSLAFTPDGTRLFATSGNEDVRQWDMNNPESPSELPPFRDHTAYVSGLAVSPDSKRLATVSHDSTLKLWDLSDGALLVTLHGHNSAVNCLAWAPGGQTIYTGGGDTTVRIWHAPTWEEIESGEDAP